ncbi:MAG: sensor histidine kinase [Desulfobacterales bacterium]|jgi:Na+/proline symporter/nitrogen-specific signal transduction histidine kinase|nr:sensor histidine kinase [Desulfobacterales bacterium]
MLTTELILLAAFGYVGVLFAIAHWGDRRAAQGRSIISNPYIYALSLAVYCTAWTFYGSVGRAAASGLGFLPTYIGPTLACALGWVVLRKIIRISKTHRITSIADFIASRYGKSGALASLVTIIAVVGIIPYISLQLKAISMSYNIISQYPLIVMPRYFADIPVLRDTAFYVALLLALFAILFGTRHLDATERHEGLVAAIAFESLVKLVAFIAAGLFVTYGIYRGFGDLFTQAATVHRLQELFIFETRGSGYFSWGLDIMLSMVVLICLPRQFQVMVVENVDESHLQKAIWLFPLYLLAINLFVLPIAFGGAMQFAAGVDADTFVLTLPMARRQEALSLLVFIGGMSAATGMVIVETVALSTMICNDLVMPVLLRLPFARSPRRRGLSGLVLNIRRGSIALVVLSAYAYFRFVGEAYALVSIGLMSFVAVAQFAPAMLGAIFWRQGTRAGAISGLVAGFAAWCYTLVLPSLVEAGLISEELITWGPWQTALLKPLQLFGLQGLDPIAHALFWSLLLNTSCYMGVSLFSRKSALELTQAALFVDVFTYPAKPEDSSLWRGSALVTDLSSLLERFLGKQRTAEALGAFARERSLRWGPLAKADPALVTYAETLLAGAIGSASARVMVASVVTEEPLGLDEVMHILDETRQVIAYSRELEQATADLKTANERLQELDRLKNEFISTVTHELRTPLTAVRSIAEILNANPKLPADQYRHLTGIIITESERLTRLINQVLDFQRIQTGRMAWQPQPLDFGEVCREALRAARPLMAEKRIELLTEVPQTLPPAHGDRDRLVQAVLNLLSNAVKFCDTTGGRIALRLAVHPDRLQVEVTDNGAGIHPEDLKVIFEEFRQARHSPRGRPSGSGLGLAITRRIVEFHGGRIWAESAPGQGSTFAFTLPVSPPPPD